MFIIIKSFKELKNLIDKEIDELIEKYSLDEYNELNNLEILSSDCNKLIRYLDSENNKYIDSQKIDESIDILSDSFNEVDSELNKDYLRKVEMANSSYKSMLRKFNLEKDEIYNSLKLNNNEFLGKIKNVNTVHNKELVSESLKIIGEKSKPLIDITKQKIMDKDFNRVERKIKTYYEGINYKDKITLLARDYEVDCIGLNGITNELNRVKYDKSVNIADRKDLEKDKNKLEKKIKGFEDIYKNKSKDEYVEPIKPFSFKVDFITSLSYTFGGLTPFVPLIILILFVIIYINFVAVNVTTFGIVAFPIFSSLVYVLFKGFFDEHFEDSQRKMVILGIVGIVSVSTMFMPISYYIVSFFSFVGLYALTLIYISSKDFNKNTKKLLNETRLDIVYIYNEADKLLMPLISKLSTTRNGDDNYAKLKSLILYIQFGYVSVYKKACNKYYGIDNVEQLNIEKLKSRNSSNNNSGVSEMFGNNDGDGLGDMFGGSDISNGFGNDDMFGDMFGGGSDSFGIDDEFGIDMNEKIADEGDINNPRFKEWVKFFEKNYNCKKGDDKWGSLDIRVPTFLSNEGDLIEIHRIEQDDITPKMLNDKRDILERIFKMDVVEINKNYNNNREFVIMFATTDVIPSTVLSDIEVTNDDFYTLGKTILGEDVIIEVNAKATPHINVSGGSGSGKTVLMFNLIHQMVNKNEMLVFLDGKGVTFPPLKDKNYRVETVKDMEGMKKLIKTIIDEMEARNDLFSSINTTNVISYNQKVSEEEKLPKLFVVFDELNILKESGEDIGEEMIKMLQRVWSQGRSAGIHVLDALQNPLKEFFGKSGKMNHEVHALGMKVYKSGIEESLGKEYVEKIGNLPQGKDKGHFYVKTNDGVFYIRPSFIDEDDYMTNVIPMNKWQHYVLGEARIGESVKDKSIILKKDNVDDEELFNDLNFL